MNLEILERITLAGLLHDVGKLLERGNIFSEEVRGSDHYLSYCPQNKEKGYPTHIHAAYTRKFCEWLDQKFDVLRTASDKSWMDWCAAHHRDDETGFESTVIRESDRYSSSEREEGNYYQPNIHRKTRLEPVLERVFLSENNRLSFRHRFPLKRLTSERSSFFPVLGIDIGLQEMPHADEAIPDPKTWNHLIAPTVLDDDHRELGEGLLSEIDALSQQCPDISLSDLIVCLMTLLERYTANVPSATNLRHPDISLFDHLRTTAAIAQALYVFKTDHPKQPAETAWLMVYGDFAGIQKFIYNLTNKGAAKGLRGRSFYVQYFCRICADFILRELGLLRPALLYNSGGTFFMLIPSHFKNRLPKIRKTINQWLLKMFQGTVYFGIGTADVTAKMFSQGKMSDAWKNSTVSLGKDRMNRFKEFLSNEDFFEPAVGFDPTESCAVCGTRLIKKGNHICSMCESLKNLGSWLKEVDVMLTVWDKSSEGIGDILNTKRILSFDGLGSHAIFISEHQLRDIAGRKISGDCILLNELGDKPFSDLKLPNCAISTSHIGKSDAQKDWDFEQYADESKGISRLGVLRMDVDNLGTIFIKGLIFPDRSSVKIGDEEKKGWGGVIYENNSIVRKPMASISRVVTLSRQLNHFFSGYVPSLLTKKNFNQCQVIYAGGDDLFVIGSWHQLPDLAKTIRREFQEFCCQNPDFSISGGLTLQGGKYPIYKGALFAEKAEKQAKKLREEWKPTPNSMKKDGFCFLNVPMLWEDWELAEEIRKIFESEIENNNRGFMSWLSQMTGTNRIKVQNLCRGKGLTVPESWKKIQYDSWRWRTAYQLRRRYKNNNNEIEKWSNLLFADNGSNAVLPVYTWIEMPLRWADYLHRKKGGK